MENGKEFSGDEIFKLQGANFKPPWIETKNGVYTHRIESLTDGGYFIISLGGRKDLEVTVTVTREIIPEPNWQLLN